MQPPSTTPFANGHITVLMEDERSVNEHRRRTAEFERGIDPSVQRIPGLKDAVLSQKSFRAPAPDTAQAHLVCE